MARQTAFWAPEFFDARRTRLHARARIVKAARNWFEREDFVEIEPSALQVSPGNETHIAGFATRFEPLGAPPTTYYLHSSPEFDCKKLLAAGERRIFSLAHVFRNGERTRLHHPEFAMLEWYRAETPYRVLIDDCAALFHLAAEAADACEFRFGGSRLDPRAAPEILSVTQAFARHAGVDLPALLDDRDGLAREAARLGVRVSADDHWSDLFSKIMSEKIEKNLGHGRATALIDYPASEAALARRKPEDPRFAERFELYGCGVELANAFGELTDPVEQRRRFEADMAERARIYGSSFPIDEDFLEALAFMPPASGCALGLDRLVMLATGADHIEDVLWAPVAAPEVKAP
ncbi:EF-P lysine aminoacylase GenX [Rhodoblastus acidophilus]|uniref:EF-P lysine aminoacylase GenX n=1 Tax=Candidatus Rhodoblastus alkanivorans TaxID=2954117 RepID=A0ABS9Z2J2_9HYPH|nr:EF-P lysine aminoacylase EpmA [Candidatus Rhodoblastus alkanivorans]MCI4677535.1 EF-P lysine aminoacylase GenX [Candidatus Rhodoblastus alkanivorans]MCI4681894.1 EF-P lysine aminoacylase GenX [Candidatus Rhodoblastus alkanivorans]MDI4642944.1 EF-P lysine aminoacylase GenX [Rhodoblastus acidophilus]